jgi:hypothetical protein
LALGCTLVAQAARAQTCCARLDLPLSGSERGGNAAGELVAGLSYEYDLLAGGRVEDGFGAETIHSQRVVLDVGYGLCSWLTPSVTTSFTVRTLQIRIGGARETRSVHGLGDTTVLVKAALLGAGALAPGEPRLWLAPGLKLPTGPFSQEDRFGPIPPPTQVGTGSFDPVGAVFFSVGLAGEASRALLLATAVGRFVTENPDGYRAGHSLELATLVQLTHVSPVSLRAGPLLRITAPDRQGAIELSASGSTLLGARAGAVYSASDSLGFSLELLLPVHKDLRGSQLDPLFTVALGVLVSHLP